MRILHVVHQFAPHHVGGTEIYTQALARAQAAAGHAVAVFTRVRSEGRKQLSVQAEGDLTVYRFFEPEPSGAPAQFRDSYQNEAVLSAFRRVAAEYAPDLVHIQHLKGMHHAIPREANAPVLTTLHDYWYFCGNAQLLRPHSTVCSGPRLWLNCVDCAAHRAKSALWWGVAPAVAGLFAHRAACLAGALRAARRIIAPSQFVYDVYAQRFALGERLRLIEHGIEPLPDVPRVPAPDTRLRILYAGGLTPQKGVHILIEAFRRMPPGTATLDICGDERADAPYVAQLKKLADGLPVRFHGALDRAELAAQMAACDVVAIPSLWPETASLIAMEARAAGLPIMASDIGALRERVRSAADGWLVPPGDVGEWAEALNQVARNTKALRTARPSAVDSIDQHRMRLDAVYQAMRAKLLAKPALR
ncbi:MAG: glycosyltransferase [Chloroflexi bacterium]|nr:glycosyltransferase [Chloroflexota bacterium]